MAQLNQPIPDDLHKAVRIAAAEKGVTIKQYVIDALRAATEADEKKRQRHTR